MKGPALCCVALAGLFAMMLLCVGAFSAIGGLLWVVWTYAVLAIWPTFPVITWWQFGLMAFGLNVARNLIVGVK